MSAAARTTSVAPAVTISAAALDAIKRALDEPLGGSRAGVDRTSSAARARLAVATTMRTRDAERLRVRSENLALDPEALDALVKRKDVFERPFDVSRKLRKLEERAGVLTVLAKQVEVKEERRRRTAAEEAEEARATLAAVAVAAAREVRVEEVRRAARVAVKAALVDQLAERALAKEVAAEEVEQEGEQMKRSAAAAVEAEAAAAKRRLEAARRNALEIVAANKRFAEREAARRAAEAAEDARMLEEQHRAAVAEEAERRRRELAKVAREREHFERLAEQRRKREIVVGDDAYRLKLREQEKVFAERREEAARAARVEEERRAIKASLQAQIMMKEARAAAEAVADKARVDAERAAVAAALRADVERARAKAGVAVEYRRDLEHTMAVKATDKSLSGTTSHEERLRLAALAEADRIVKERMREETLARLAAAGAPAKIIDEARRMAL